MTLTPVSKSVFGLCMALAAVAVFAQSHGIGAWVAKDANWAASKATLQALGEKYATSDALFDALKQAANGGKPLSFAQLGQPAHDWTGVYTRTAGGLNYDPDLPPGPPSQSGPASAHLTPAGLAVVKAKAEALIKTGGEFDPLSKCSPPGTPRWFTEPFLREFVVTPGQTLLINEMVNDIRRVYTDGRRHTPADDAYGSPNGDTIGFWSGDMLVAHTKYLNAGQYQRGVQPNFSDQVTVVERWRKANPKTLEVDVWVYDPANLAKPWYTRQSFSKLGNDDYNLRIRYWDCGENSNNTIIEKDDGTSQFKDFSFVPDDAAASNDEAVKKAAQAAKP